MPQNHQVHCSETETPLPSPVQDYLARKYASLGIQRPEPNGHQPDHIPATPSDQRCDVAPKPPDREQQSDLAGTEGDEQSNTAKKHADSVRSVRFENAESGQPPHPSPTPGEQQSDLANSPPEAGSRTPEAAFVPSPYACIAMMFLEYDDTAETRFYDRLAHQRKDHEAALERLEAKLNSLQQRRESSAKRQRANPSPAIRGEDTAPKNGVRRWLSAS